MGSSLSVRGFARLGASLSVVGALKIADDITFTVADKGIYGNNAGGTPTRRISFPQDGSGPNVLHGEWTADQTFTISDRRHKTNVVPLHRTLESRMNAVEMKSPSSQKALRGGDANAPDKRSAAVDWVLRQLRPVSFQFRQASEAKAAVTPRYGFIAQDVERVFPELVVESGHSKHMIYQDLIALLTVVVQNLQMRLEQYHTRLEHVVSLVENLDLRLEGVQKMNVQLQQQQQQRGPAVVR